MAVKKIQENRLIGDELYTIHHETEAILTLYDNTNSDLVSKNAQDAITELAARPGDDYYLLRIGHDNDTDADIVVAEAARQDYFPMKSTVATALNDIDGILDDMYTVVTGQSPENHQSELNNLIAALDHIASETNFNGKKLLDGSMSSTTAVTAKFNALSFNDSGSLSDVTVSNQYIAAIDLSGVNKEVGDLGRIANTAAEDGLNVQLNIDTSDKKITVKFGGTKYSATFSETLESGSTLKLVQTGTGNEENSITITLNQDISTSSTLTNTDIIGFANIGVLYGGQDVGDKALNLQIGDTAVTIDLRSMNADSIGISVMDVSSSAGVAVAKNAILGAKHIVATVSDHWETLWGDATAAYILGVVTHNTFVSASGSDLWRIGYDEVATMLRSGTRIICIYSPDDVWATDFTIDAADVFTGDIAEHIYNNSQHQIRLGSVSEITGNEGCYYLLSGDTGDDYGTLHQEMGYIAYSCAHTDNLDDTGSQISSGYSNTAWTQVLTVSGANQLEVTVTYQAQTYYGYGCIWSGSHSEYTAQDNYASSLTGKLGGETKTTTTFLVSGDTITVGWNPQYNYSGYYGMYVVVKAAKPAIIQTITSSSTDLEYPSAKAVWDLFNSIVNGNEVSY